MTIKELLELGEKTRVPQDRCDLARSIDNYEDSLPLMEAKLREMMEVLPEIKGTIENLSKVLDIVGNGPGIGRIDTSEVKEILANLLAKLKKWEEE